MTTEKPKTKRVQPNPIVSKAAEDIARPALDSPQLALFPLHELTPRRRRKNR